jgi:hypothetical protein
LDFDRCIAGRRSSVVLDLQVFKVALKGFPQ